MPSSIKSLVPSPSSIPLRVLGIVFFLLFSATCLSAPPSANHSTVFIQQEQEGNLWNPDPRDSTGSVFNYYRPTQMIPELVQTVRSKMSFTERLAFPLWRGLMRDPWAAFSTRSKLRY